MWEGVGGFYGFAIIQKTFIYICQNKFNEIPKDLMISNVPLLYDMVLKASDSALRRLGLIQAL